MMLENQKQSNNELLLFYPLVLGRKKESDKRIDEI